MKKHYIIAGLVVAGLTLIGAGCTGNQTTSNTTTPAVTNSAGNTNVEQTISVELSATGGDINFNETVAVESGATVLDVMEEAADEYDFEYTSQDSDFGVFVDTVGGVEGNAATSEYWLFYVNDQAASTGVDATVVEEGDVVEWRYQGAEAF